ncbi:MAG TPA: GNAT family N-acetyltransferase [Candidatus Wunengus sp. YC63]|uniref:GNAT family N-acetyltransferase n=1 Tax=Candidatus Wunengus sp. YC63 TaxID=3367699 RepID=UPI004024C602
MNYCKATLLDLFALEQLEKDCFQAEAFSRRLIKNLLINTKSAVFKATEPTGKIIGNIIGTTKKENSTSVGRIFSLCVLGQYRKIGIASQLVKILEEEFYLRNIKKIRLEVSALNNVAQAFYERLEYHMTPEILPHFYHDGTDACVMTKRLP